MIIQLEGLQPVSLRREDKIILYIPDEVASWWKHHPEARENAIAAVKQWAGFDIPVLVMSVGFDLVLVRSEPPEEASEYQI